MIDIQGELLAIETEWDRQYISIADLLHWLKNGNENINYGHVATVLLKKLSKLNVDLIDWYEEHPEAQLEPDPIIYIVSNYGICTYLKGDDNSAISLLRKRHNLFFDFLAYIKNSKANLEHIKLSLDEFDIEQINAKDVFIEVKKIEKELNITIPQDREPYDCIKVTLQNIKNVVRKQRELELLKEENKKLKSRIEELSKNPNSSLQIDRIAELEKENDVLKKELEELKPAQTIQLPTVEEKQNRTSQPQRDIFSLLVIKCYPDCSSRNNLFDLINADLRTEHIITSEIKYPTFDKLIDERLRINNKSPFPQKNRN